jgi:hypothetical protein
LKEKCKKRDLLKRGRLVDKYREPAMRLRRLEDLKTSELLANPTWIKSDPLMRIKDGLNSDKPLNRYNIIKIFLT